MAGKERRFGSISAVAKLCEGGYYCPYKKEDMLPKKCPVKGKSLPEDQAIERCIMDEMKPSFRERLGLLENLPPQE